ncbi:Metallophosphoesterase [Thalictrum thalictroides]|uniref:Metallophosphoesterase n=1 Tax=Thalictrum thalictroides TaxID=46969 RepID=A0A7J6W2T3_THATH|nr:Metallophosphoesterase [Thalictrum thalictroides]
MVAWKSTLPLIIIIGLVIFEERVSIPSCKIVPRDDGNEIEEVVDNDREVDSELRVMMVANLLLMGSEAGYMNMYFRDSYLAKFFRKSFERLEPDMLIVLGDVSATGSVLTKSRWLSVLQQFQRILGPFLALPLHVVLGDRDIGECHNLNVESVKWLASNFPGLDSSGCGGFDVSNISFVSLNAVALLCGSNDLRFSIEKVIERESLDLHGNIKTPTERSCEPNRSFSHFGWRETDMESGSGPVLLLHFPLHGTINNDCQKNNLLRSSLSAVPDGRLKWLHNRGTVRPSPYELLHTLSPNATEYIFQALKPRIIFSAHSNGFCDHTHEDGTREITVPAMTWDARDDPGFVVATFGRNGGVIVSQCSLPKESHVIMAYITILVLLVLTTLVASESQLTNLLK